VVGSLSELASSFELSLSVPLEELLLLELEDPLELLALSRISPAVGYFSSSTSESEELLLITSPYTGDFFSSSLPLSFSSI
jgi:hypothetical protein